MTHSLVRRQHSRCQGILSCFYPILRIGCTVEGSSFRTVAVELKGSLYLMNILNQTFSPQDRRTANSSDSRPTEIPD